MRRVSTVPELYHACETGRHHPRGMRNAASNEIHEPGADMHWRRNQRMLSRMAPFGLGNGGPAARTRARGFVWFIVATVVSSCGGVSVSGTDEGESGGSGGEADGGGGVSGGGGASGASDGNGGSAGETGGKGGASGVGTGGTGGSAAVTIDPDGIC